MQLEWVQTGAMRAREKRRVDVLSMFLRGITSLAALLTAAIVVFLIGYILVMGVRHLSPELFSWTYTSDNGSMTPAIINTIVMVAVTLLISVPLGVGAAIYMTEYARRGSRLVRVVRMLSLIHISTPSTTS